MNNGKEKGAAAPKKTKSAVKTRLAEWEEPQKLILITGWARDGLTDEQISHNMGCAYSTFREWKKKSKALSAALKTGKEVADYMVENALFQAAMEGNTTAQIFWLKNRKPKQWRDKVEEESNDNTITVKIEGSLADYAD